MLIKQRDEIIQRIVSKAAVMNVIGFLFVSKGNNTEQFHDSLGSRRTCVCSEASFGSRNDGIA